MLDLHVLSVEKGIQVGGQTRRPALSYKHCTPSIVNPPLPSLSILLTLPFLVCMQELWYDPDVADERQILSVWEQMLRHVAWRWNLLGIDIKNEPHGWVR